MYHTLLDLNVPVHGGRFRRNRELVDSLQFNITQCILLTSVKDDIWLRTGVSVVHFEDATPPHGICRIWSSVLLQSILHLNRTQFIEMLCVFSVLNNPSFHKGCLNIPSQGAMQFLSDIPLDEIGPFADWLSYQDYGFRFSSPIFEINEALVSCRVYYSVKPGPNVAELMDRLLIPDKVGDPHGGRDDIYLRSEGGRDASGKWHFPVPGYGFVLPHFLELFPRLEHKLKEHAIRSKGNGRAIPVIALRYLRRNTDDCAASIDPENMSSLEDGLRISHRSHAKIRQDIIHSVWGNPDISEAPLIPFCPPEIPTATSPITSEDILAFNRFQIVCEALWLQCPHAFVVSPANTPAFYANDGLYRSQLLRIRRVDRFGKALTEEHSRITQFGADVVKETDIDEKRSSNSFQPVEWCVPRYSEFDDESVNEDILSVSTISPRGSPRGIERSSFRRGAADAADWVSIAHEGVPKQLTQMTKSCDSTALSHDIESLRSISPRSSDYRTFEVISGKKQSQGIAFDATIGDHPPRPPDSKFFPSPGNRSFEFPISSPPRSGGSGALLSPDTSHPAPAVVDDVMAPYANLLGGDLGMAGDLSMSLFSSGQTSDVLGSTQPVLGGLCMSHSADNFSGSTFLSTGYHNDSSSMYDILSSDGPTLLDTLSAMSAPPSNAVLSDLHDAGPSLPPIGPSSSLPPPGFLDSSISSQYLGNTFSAQADDTGSTSSDGGWGLKIGVNVPILQFSALPKDYLNRSGDGEKFNGISSRISSSVPFAGDVKVQDTFRTYEQDILSHIDKFQISIIEGSPGCGKSMGIPSVLYDNAMKSSGKLSLVMAQHDPFVALSIKSGLEKIYGSDISLLTYTDEPQTPVSEITGCKIWLSTTIFLARYIAKNPEVLQRYTHVVLDDANERTMESDLICLLAKAFISIAPHLRVVLVSATPNIELYKEYFALPDSSVLVIGESARPVDIYYTDDLLGLLPPKFDKLINKIHTGYCNRAQEMQSCAHQDSSGSPYSGYTTAPVGINTGGMNASAATFQYTENRDKFTGSSPVSTCRSRSSSNATTTTVTISDATIRDQLDLALELTLTVGKPGETLVIFVAGLIDMFELSEKFEIRREMDPKTAIFDIYRFHAEMTETERIAALAELPSPDYVKVVIVGDLSESSVNVSNVNHVLCLGSCKMLTMNETYRAFQQVNYFISQAVANQRAGKTGRTCHGTVYRLYAKEFYSCLPSHTSGDILRLPIPKVLMQVSFMLEDCAVEVASKGIPTLLMMLPESPPPGSVETGLDILSRAKVMGSDMKLTKFGLFACELGKDLSVCNMLFDGITLGIGSIAVVIAATMMLRRSPFKCASSAIYPEPDDYYEIVRSTVCAKAKLDDGYLSEPLMLLSLLIRWRRCRNEDETLRLCSKYGLSHSRMDDFDKSVKQLTSLVAAIIGVKMDIPSDMSAHIPARVANMARLISVWSFPENICKMDAINNPPSSNLNCAVIQAQRDITHSLFERLLLGPRDGIIDGPDIKWKLVERGKKTYTAIAVERPFKDTLISFKSVFMNMNAQVGWIECKHLDPEEVVIIVREELHSLVGEMLTKLFPTVDIIGIHEGVALFVIVSPSAVNMRRMIDVYFDSYSSISFVTSATNSKQRRIYYHATLSCCNCQPSVAHIRHIFLRSTPFCRPCANAFSRECHPSSPCDLHWKVTAPELVERFSNWFFKTKVLNASTLLSFSEDPPSAYTGSIPPRAFTVRDIPIGLRILNSIRSGSQKNQVLHLSDGSSRSGGTSPSAGKVDVKMKTAEPQWISFRHDLVQVACGVGILANSAGTPKRVVMPLQSLQQVGFYNYLY
jgi:HrpA-like RNA helicase